MLIASIYFRYIEYLGFITANEIQTFVGIPKDSDNLNDSTTMRHSRNG